MSSALDHVMNTPQMAIGKGTVGEPKHVPGYKGVIIKVAISFDGTKNNRSNTLKRLRDSSIMVGKGKDDESSYANFFSNVAIMELLNKRKEPANREISVYIEGIGTENFIEGAVKKDKSGKELKDKNGKAIKLTDAENGNDDSIGYALGSGTTGIFDKVTKGIIELQKKIKGVYKPGPKGQEYVSKLVIDVVGFSRGAAAARHFVSLLRNERPLAARLGVPRAKVVIKFVGVFDTVSSYGVGLSFGSSVAELGLALGKLPQKVVHLTAGDECRANFSLTDITSSLGGGYELTLPGVHSDVGGGYGEVEDEMRTFSPGERARLLAEGWYTPAQLRESIRVLPAASPYVSPATIPCLVGTRRALRWHYQFISLRLMATLAKEHGVGLADTSGKFGKYALSPGHELLPVQAAIEAAAAAHNGRGRHTLRLEELPLGAPLARRVHNAYLHQSVSESVGMSANFIDGQPRRQVFPG